MSTLYVINPNSTQAVTDAIDVALEPLRSGDAPAIECVTLAEGPPGIETQRDVDGVVMPLLKRAAALENSAGAFVIACFSDPGLHSLREQSARPVLGIAECGVLTALSIAPRFGVLAILPGSIPRHQRYFAAMGVTDRLAGEVAVDVGVVELADEQRTFARLTECGRTLRDQHRADVVVMGCAGMARYRAALEDDLTIPVVEPTQAAVTMAIGRVRLGGTAKRFGK
ncbi:MAG TPA: aspartate/glutamate racemase family protein [Xanthobacteraceae bacterium]|nr:aspartate/glutamate racemase family protein [Xanthobacteraceae bacterium]